MNANAFTFGIVRRVIDLPEVDLPALPAPDHPEIDAADLAARILAAHQRARSSPSAAAFEPKPGSLAAKIVAAGRRVGACL